MGLGVYASSSSAPRPREAYQNAEHHMSVRLPAPTARHVSSRHCDAVRNRMGDARLAMPLYDIPWDADTTTSRPILLARPNVGGSTVSYPATKALNDVRDEVYL